MKGKIVYFLTIVICFLLQCTVMDLISIGSVTPNLMLVFCVSMGLMRGRKSGLWAGFFSGLFVDLFFGSVFGFYALIYMYIGYLSGYAHRIYYDDDVKVPFFVNFSPFFSASAFAWAIISSTSTTSDWVLEAISSFTRWVSSSV